MEKTSPVFFKQNNSIIKTNLEQVRTNQRFNEQSFCIKIAVAFLQYNIEFFIAAAKNDKPFEQWANSYQGLLSIIHNVSQRIYKSLGTKAKAEKYLQALYLDQGSLKSNDSRALEEIFRKNQYFLDHIIAYSNLLSQPIQKWYIDHKVKHQFNYPVSPVQLAVAANIALENETKILDLSNKKITPKDMPYLAYLLCNKSHLTQLSFNNCGITDEQIKELAILFVNNKNLMTIDLCNNFLTATGVCELIRAQKKEFLKEFFLQNNSIFQLKDIVSTCAQKSIEGVVFYLTLFEDEEKQKNFQTRWDNKFFSLKKKENTKIELFELSLPKNETKQPPVPPKPSNPDVSAKVKEQQQKIKLQKQANKKTIVTPEILPTTPTNETQENINYHLVEQKKKCVIC